MTAAALERIALRLPIRPICHEGGLYLKRYYVTTLPKWLGGWRIYLHHFLLSDPDGLHNHPFNWSFSFILVGWYWERTRQGLQKKRWFNWLGKDRMHRVELPTSALTYTAFNDYNQIPVPCWTLFIHSPRNCDWAFVREMPVPFNHIYKEQLYERVNGGKPPTPFSDWYKTAPTGKEWEEAQQQTAALRKYGPMVDPSKFMFPGD